MEKGKVIMICGKICSGKTFYANTIKSELNAVILSCDEVTSILFDNNLGEKHDEMAKRIRIYLFNKACEITNCGVNVILDWGFWSKQNRQSVKEYFKAKDIICEMHYIDIDDETWQKNIKERNEKVLNGNGGYDYYLDEGLLNKLFSIWQTPSQDEIDHIYTVER